MIFSGCSYLAVCTKWYITQTRLNITDMWLNLGSKVKRLWHHYEIFMNLHKLRRLSVIKVQNADQRTKFKNCPDKLGLLRKRWWHKIVPDLDLLQKGTAVMCLPLFIKKLLHSSSRGCIHLYSKGQSLRSCNEFQFSNTSLQLVESCDSESQNTNV